MNIRKRAECNCIICGKQFYPSSKMSGKYCSRLRLICPNCDSQLDTYKSKNKNSDRIYYHNHHR